MSLPEHTPHTSSDAPKLPTEIMDRVLARVARSELSSFDYVSKHLRQTSMSISYRSVFIHAYDHEDVEIAEMGSWPPGIFYPTIGMEGAASFAINFLARIVPQLPSYPLFDPFSCITRLCLHTHHSSLCADLQPPVMHNLHTLQILPLFREEDVRLDACYHDLIPTSSDQLDVLPHPTCSIISELRPAQVILGGACTSLVGDAAGLWTGEFDFPPASLQELIVYIGALPVLPGRSFLPNLPNSVRRLTLVFQPLLEISANGDAREVQIVGLEQVEGHTVGLPDSEVEHTAVLLREMMVLRNQEMGRSWREAEVLAGRVFFTERDVWEAREGTIRQVRPRETPSAAPIPKLPVVVLNHVIARTDRSDFPFTVQLNRALHATILPLLYDRVRIVVCDRDDSLPHGYIAPIDRIPRGDNRAAVGMKGATCIAIYNLPTLEVALPTFPLLPHRFTHLTRLCLDVHYPSQCVNYHPLVLPKLDVLQFLPMRNGEPSNLDICSGSLHDMAQSNEPKHTSPHCPLVGTLRPRQIRLGDRTTGLVGDAGGLWDTLNEHDEHIPLWMPPRWLEEITIFVGQRILQNGRTLFSRIPVTIKRLTLVFESRGSKWEPDAIEWYFDPALDEAEDEEDGHWPDSYALKYVWRRLARVCKGRAEVVEIVGIEMLDRAWSRMPVKEAKEQLLAEVVKQMLKRGKSRAEADKRVEGIIFLERADWEEREG